MLAPTRVSVGTVTYPPAGVLGPRAKHGTTPKAYLWRRRVALANDLLINTGLPLSTIAERSGFKTAHHFSRRIKLATGLPPAALRRERWGSSSVTGPPPRGLPAS